MNTNRKGTTMDTTDFRLEDQARAHEILDAAGAPQYAQVSDRIIALIRQYETA